MSPLGPNNTTTINYGKFNVVETQDSEINMLFMNMLEDLKELNKSIKEIYENANKQWKEMVSLPDLPHPHHHDFPG